jgi:hypothetical protein
MGVDLLRNRWRFQRNGHPGVILIVSVMKRAFSDGEKAMLADLVQWSWDRSGDGPRAHVLLMTGVELFARHHVEQAWKEAGTPYSDKADYHTFADLREFAYATQRIHLGLDRFVKLRSAVRASAAKATIKPAQREEGGDGAG